MSGRFLIKSYRASPALTYLGAVDLYVCIARRLRYIIVIINIINIIIIVITVITDVGRRAVSLPTGLPDSYYIDRREIAVERKFPDMRAARAERKNGWFIENSRRRCCEITADGFRNPLGLLNFVFFFFSNFYFTPDLTGRRLEFDKRNRFHSLNTTRLERFVFLNTTPFDYQMLVRLWGVCYTRIQVTITTNTLLLCKIWRSKNNWIRFSVTLTGLFCFSFDSDRLRDTIIAHHSRFEFRF